MFFKKKFFLIKKNTLPAMEKISREIFQPRTCLLFFCTIQIFVTSHTFPFPCQNHRRKNIQVFCSKFWPLPAQTMQTLGGDPSPPSPATRGFVEFGGGGGGGGVWGHLERAFEIIIINPKCPQPSYSARPLTASKILFLKKNTQIRQEQISTEKLRINDLFRGF